MQLIDNAHQLLKLSSVQIAGASAALAIAEQALPQLQAVIPPAAYGILSLLVILARAIKQTKLAA